jgi:serine protease Do
MATTEKRIPQNINFAIRAAIATAFLEANSIEFKVSERGAARPPTEIAEQATKMSVRIHCIDAGGPRPGPANTN